MNVYRAHMLIVALGLTAAVLSMVLLSVPWHHGVTGGRNFPIVAGYISTLALVSSIPFAWPFLVAGLWLGWQHAVRPAVWYLLSMVLAGAVLQSLLTSAQFPADAPLRSYIGFHSGFLAAPLLAVMGFVIGHARAFRGHQPPNQAMQRTAGRTNA